MTTSATTITTARVPAPRAPQRAGPGPRRGPRPVQAPTSRAALGLLRQAADGLAEAHRVEDPLLRYPAAYLAALRAGAAVLAVRARPQPRRGATRNVWRLLAEVAPEFAEWAAFFAATEAKRDAVRSGETTIVSAREADDLVRDARAFLRLVERSLG